MTRDEMEQEINLLLHDWSLQVALDRMWQEKDRKALMDKIIQLVEDFFDDN